MTTLPGTAVGGPDNTSWTPANDGSCSQTQHSQLEGDYLADPAASNFDSSNTVDPAEDIFTSKKKMRRRSRKKTLKILHLLTPGRVIALAILFLCQRSWAEPGYLDFDNLPETNFTCAGKVIGGYYADLETSCQMFHVCTIGQLDEPMDIKFLCLNGTVFDQETRVCERVDEVDCSKSERFYYLNLELYGNTMVPMPEDGEGSNSNGGSPEGLATSTISSSSPSTTKSPVSSTASTTTTTARPSSATTKRTNYQHNFNIHQSPPPAQQPQPAQAHPTPSYTFNGTRYNLNDPKQKQSFSSTTTYSTPVHFLSSTLSPKISTTQTSGGNKDEVGDQFEDEEEVEYEYDEDYVVVTEHATKSGGGTQTQKPFSPQQFIFDQKVKNTQAPTKPAISFQQQRFQNNGPSQFSTSHHGTNKQNEQTQQSVATGTENRQQYPTTNRPSYTNYYPQQSPQQPQQQQQQPQQSNQLPKRIPLLTLGQQQQQQLQNNINFQQQQQLNFRVRGSGFQLPAGPPPPPLPQPRPFAGYQRPPPPQVPLQLPFESQGQSPSLREQKDLLGFEDVAESFITPQQERKDSKRSDDGNRYSVNQVVVVEGGNNGGRRNANSTTEKTVFVTPRADPEGDKGDATGDENDEDKVEKAVEDSAVSHNLKKYSTASYPNNNNNNNVQEPRQGQQPLKYDKTLLIPQERYKSTLPKIIITASASVSTASGKKLNYSLGNVLGKNKELKIPPPTYDEYKEEDVFLDPFFQDVPKIVKTEKH